MVRLLIQWIHFSVVRAFFVALNSANLALRLFNLRRELYRNNEKVSFVFLCRVTYKQMCSFLDMRLKLMQDIDDQFQQEFNEHYERAFEENREPGPFYKFIFANRENEVKHE